MKTISELISKVKDYATERGLHFDLDEMSAPPALLQGLIRAPGLCLTVKEPEPTGEPAAQLGIWLSTACSEVTRCMMQEDDDEIETTAHNLPGDEERLAFIDRSCRDFYLQYVYIPAVEAWASEADVGYQIIKPVDFAGEATLFDCRNWFFIEFKTPQPGEYDLTVGISGDGQAATFMDVDGDGWLDFDERAPTLKNGSDLMAWLNKLLSND